MDNILISVNNGLARAQQEFNSRPQVTYGAEPPFYYGIIVCAMRMFGPAFSEYYASLFNVHQYSSNNEVFELASYELVRATVRIRDEQGLPIVGIDLAGQEEGYPAENHRRAYDYAQKHFLKKTVHAGEAYGPESIFQAITDLYADRLGHGYHLFSPDLIQSQAITNRQGYVDALARYIADRRITIEVCLTSNLQTMPALTSTKEHAFNQMLKARLSVTLCTDNRLVSRTSVSNEIELALRDFDLTPHLLKSIIIYGFKRSFFPGSYPEKRAYVRQIINYYEKIQHAYGVND